MRTRVIYGCHGTELLPEEKQFFRDAQPWVFILFGRNIAAPEQVHRLVDSLRECVADENAAVLIDQEGGRVARLKPPHWKDRPSAAKFGALKQKSPSAARESAYLNARL